MNAGDDSCPMQRAWETLLAQARTNHKAQENIADLIQVQREVVQVNRIMAEATLLTMRRAQGCCEMPGQEDELQAWYHDAHVVVANAKASVDSDGNAIGETEVMEVPGGGRGLPQAPLRSNGAGVWEVIEDGLFEGLGSSGVHEEVTPEVLGTFGGDL